MGQGTLARVSRCCGVLPMFEFQRVNSRVVHQQPGIEMAFGRFKLKGNRATGKLVSRDRQHFEARARRFLERYLTAGEHAKPRFYRVVVDAVQACRVQAGVVRPSPHLEDAQIAMAISNAATAMFLEATRPNAGDRVGEFGSDAYATVAIAYRRAAGIYEHDRDMRELGTAAVHLLTMAASYLNAHGNDLSPSSAELLPSA